MASEWSSSFQEAESKSEESTASGVSKSGKKNVKPVDPDPHGQKLIQVVVCFIRKMYCCFIRGLLEN